MIDALIGKKVIYLGLDRFRTVSDRLSMVRCWERTSSIRAIVSSDRNFFLAKSISASTSSPSKALVRLPQSEHLMKLTSLAPARGVSKVLLPQRGQVGFLVSIKNKLKVFDAAKISKVLSPAKNNLSLKLFFHSEKFMFDSIVGLFYNSLKMCTLQFLQKIFSKFFHFFSKKMKNNFANKNIISIFAPEFLTKKIKNKRAVGRFLLPDYKVNKSFNFCSCCSFAMVSWSKFKSERLFSFLKIFMNI